MSKKITNKIELLAPVGNLEILKVAVEAGADAVYLAGKKFGARAFATNFNNEELIEAVRYAHIRGVNVYVTVNTIIFENEFSHLEQYLKFLYEIGVDAIIVQDLGVLNLIRTKFPDFEVHASTQMNIFDENGLKILKELGIRRVVLARETSIDRIKKLTKKGIEIETFVHGALCFSASGNCLMSYSIGGRSGNRGECAQPCRKNYSLLENNLKLKINSPLLSMKDLSTIENIDKLIEAGIDSLKIEGRMKSSEYVYTVVKAYRKAIDNYFENKLVNLEKDIKDMRIIFNRGFISGHILNVNNFDLTTNTYVNHQGIEVGKVVKITPRAIEIKLSDDLSVQDAIRIENKNSTGFIVQNMFLKEEKVKKASVGDIVKIPVSVDKHFLNATVKKTKSFEISNSLSDYMKSAHKKIAITAKLKIKYQECLELIFNDGLNEVKIKGEILNNLITTPKNDSFYKEMLNKLKDTPYYLNEVEIENDQKAFVSIKDLNSLRRKAVEELSNLREKKTRDNTFPLVLTKKKVSKVEPSFEAIVHNMKQYCACVDAGIKVIYTDYESELMNLSRLKKSNENNMMVHNLSQILKNNTSSPYFNITNNKAIEVLNHLDINKIYLSYELSLEDVKNLELDGNLNIGYPVYGKMDVMVTTHCIVSKSYNYKNKKCLKCDNNNYELVDEYNNKFTIFTESDEGCNNRIIDYKVRNYKNYLNNLKKYGVNLFLLTFTTESYDETLAIIKSFQKEL